MTQKKHISVDIKTNDIFAVWLVRGNHWRSPPSFCPNLFSYRFYLITAQMLTIAVHRPATLKYRWSGEQVRSIKVSNYGEIRRRHLPPADSHSAPTECWSRRTFCREIDVRSRHRFAVAATSVISCRWRTLPPLCTTKHQCDSLVLKIKVESNRLQRDITLQQSWRLYRKMKIMRMLADRMAERQGQKKFVTPLRMLIAGPIRMLTRVMFVIANRLVEN